MSYTPPELLTPNHDVSGFDCGNDALNQYLRRFAVQNNVAGGARTYAATLRNTLKVVGYYSLAAGSVEHASAPERVAKSQARYPIPVIILARLAVDREYQRAGLGSALLKDALMRALAAADVIGIRAILVHAKDSVAAAFYLRYGFAVSPTDDHHLFLLTKEIRKALD